MNHAKLFTFKFLNVCYDRFSFCLYLYLSVLSSHKVMLSLLINVRWYRGAACLFQDNKKISFLPCFDISCFVMFFFFCLSFTHTNRDTRGNFQALHHMNNNRILLSFGSWGWKKSVVHCKFWETTDIYCVGNTRYKYKLFAYYVLFIACCC